MTETVSDSTHRSVGARIRAQRHQPLDLPLPDRVVHRRVRLRIGPRPGQARPLLRRGAGDLPHRVGTDQRARRLLPAPGREHGRRRHRRGRADRLPVARLAVERRRHQCADPVQQDRLQAERPHQDLPGAEWYGFILVWHERHGRAPYWQPPVLPELETDEYYPLHPHTRMVNRVKVHAQMIIENAADPYHVQYVHKAANPANTASFEVSGYHLHATVNANFGGGRAKTWLTPNGPVEAKIIYDNYSLGLGVVRFPSDLVATVQVTGQTPVDEDYTDYFYTQASIREPGDTGDKPTGRAAKFLQLQQEVIKQDFFTWENMKYLEKPNLAPEEARDYAALRRWAHRFYPGTEPSPTISGTPPTVRPTPRQRGCDARRRSDRSGRARSTCRTVRRPRDDVDRRHPCDIRADARPLVRGRQCARRPRGQARRDGRTVHRHMPRVGVLLARRRADRRGDAQRSTAPARATSCRTRCGCRRPPSSSPTPSVIPGCARCPTASKR